MGFPHSANVIFRMKWTYSRIYPHYPQKSLHKTAIARFADVHKSISAKIEKNCGSCKNQKKRLTFED
jgi:hypothetical protein